MEYTPPDGVAPQGASFLLHILIPNRVPVFSQPLLYGSLPASAVGRRPFLKLGKILPIPSAVVWAVYFPCLGLWWLMEPGNLCFRFLKTPSIHLP